MPFSHGHKYEYILQKCDSIQVHNNKVQEVFVVIFSVQSSSYLQSLLRGSIPKKLGRGLLLALLFRGFKFTNYFILQHESQNEKRNYIMNFKCI